MVVAQPAYFRLLGEPQLVDAGGRRTLSETAPAYLALFLAAQDGWVARETVAVHLWPELAHERSQHNLRVALNRLTRLLAGWQLAHALVAERRRLRLDVASDLADFRAALAARNWRQACTLPTGPLLEGAHFTTYPALAEWLAVEREAVRQQWRTALVQAHRAGTADEPALALYLAHHGADTDIVTLQVTRLAAAGRTAEARDALAAFVRAAADDMPAGELQIAVQGIEQTAALAVVAVGAGNAPAAPALLGRDVELAALGQAARLHRWVTLVGLPGSGKSALLRAWLQQQREADETLRTVHVELNERSTAVALAQHWVQGLTGATATRADVAAALKLLSGSHGLLIVDGVDQAGAAADIGALLTAVCASCPGVRMVCASRQPLAAQTGHVIALGGLSMHPAADAEPTALSAAAQLFLQEALRVRPDLRFEAGTADLETIALASGGLPLALKLAASWTRWLKLPAVALELARCARGARGALDESLHGLLSWSWERLPQPERESLQALALFPGAFEMGAAVTVSAHPASVIENLCAASLVETSAGQPSRLRLHALVRAFALQQLAGAPAGFRQAAARYIACVDDLLGPRTLVDGQPVFELGRVAAVIDDLLAGWQLAVETGAVGAMGWLVAALLEWHDRMGAYRPGLARLEQALALLDESQAAEAAMLARLQSARATLLYRAGDHDAAEQVALQARRLAEATGQRRVLQRALNIAGLSRWLMLRLDDAQAAFEAGLALALAAEDRRFESVFFSNLGLIDKCRGDFAGAEDRWRRALQIDRELGDWVGAVTILNNLANLLRHDGRLAECEALAAEGLRLCREHGLEGKRPFALIGLALLHWRAKKPALAADYLALLDACKAETLESTVRAGAATLRAEIALGAGDRSTALAQLGRALHIASQAGDVGNRAEALLVYGRWLWQGDQRDAATRIWQTLLAETGLHATLRDEVREQLLSVGSSTNEAELRRLDLALLTEQVMQAVADDAGLRSPA